MTERTQAQTQLIDQLGQQAEQLAGGLARHWLVVANGAVLIYVGLPFLAPLLLANGFYGAANTIYRMYGAVCHQLPSRAYFIAGQQVALCHRDVAIYTAMLLGGLLFGLVRYRLKPLRPGWYLLLILPMALDGGTLFISELTRYVPLMVFWGLGLAAITGLGLLLRQRGWLNGYWLVTFGGVLLGLLYLQFVGPYHSDWFRRTVTGALFGFATVWLVFPHMETAFGRSATPE